APIFGNLSDRFGRRPVLLVSMFGLAIDYVIMALAPTIAILFIGRVIAGATSASGGAAGAYVADVSSEDERAQHRPVPGRGQRRHPDRPRPRRIRHAGGGLPRHP